MRGATYAFSLWSSISIFQSTRPMRGATGRLRHHPFRKRFQSTRPMRGATNGAYAFIEPILFQSTRPMRGATASRWAPIRSTANFNPRAPCGARLVLIHWLSRSHLFQSTRPMRGATVTGKLASNMTVISIHAPHAGRDACHSRSCINSLNFNPRAPCGARPSDGVTVARGALFQSTRPMRGATRCGANAAVCVGISIHAPHAGRDRPQTAPGTPYRYFNPRAPCGARLCPGENAR